MTSAESPTYMAEADLHAGEWLSASNEQPRQRLSNAAWIAFSVLLLVALGATALRMRDTSSGGNLTGAIIAGERPVAPRLPSSRLSATASPLSEADWYPGLPDWYRATDGRQVASAGNEVLVVNWWASWCGPCREEAPHLVAIADAYRGHATVVGVNAGMEDLESDARAFVEEFELDFPIVRAQRADKDAWGVRGYPETFVVGRDGRISARIAGQIDPEQLRSLIDTRLKGHGDAS